MLPKRREDLGRTRRPVTRTTTHGRSTAQAVRTRVDHWHMAVQPIPSEEDCHRQALDGKELARSRQDICHTRKLQDEGSRPNVREEVGRHAAPLPCAERHTRDSLLCVAIHTQCVEEEEERFRAQHVGWEKRRASPTAVKQRLPNCRDALTRRRLSFQPQRRQGQRCKCITRVQRSSITPMQRHSSSQQKHSVEVANKPSKGTDDVTSET